MSCTAKAGAFPLYIRVPGWATKATLDGKAAAPGWATLFPGEPAPWP